MVRKLTLVEQHWAAHNDLVDGHEIVKLLVEYGADVNQVSDTGVTPLDLAQRAKRIENVRLLRQEESATTLNYMEVWNWPGFYYFLFHGTVP